MKIFDDTNEKEKLKTFKIIPSKYINEILSYFHIKNGHKGYLNLVYDTLNNGIILIMFIEKVLNLLNNV